MTGMTVHAVPVCRDKRGKGLRGKAARRRKRELAMQQQQTLLGRSQYRRHIAHYGHDRKEDQK